MKTEIQKKLEKLAIKLTTPFCYSCYIKASKSVCPQCQCDDLMRHLEGVGVEYGLDWVIKHILDEKLVPVNLEEAFEDSVRQCYPETTVVGWMTFDSIEIMKSLDPIAWRCAVIEYESLEEAEENIISFDNGSTYYWVHDVEALLDQES